MTSMKKREPFGRGCVASGKISAFYVRDAAVNQCEWRSFASG